MAVVHSSIIRGVEYLQIVTRYGSRVGEGTEMWKDLGPITRGVLSHSPPHSQFCISHCPSFLDLWFCTPRLQSAVYACLFTEGLLFLLLYMVALLPHMTIVSLMFFLCMYLNFTQLIYLTLLLFVDASHLDANVSSFLNYFSCPHVCCSHQKEKNVAIFATVTNL